MEEEEDEERKICKMRNKLFCLQAIWKKVFHLVYVPLGLKLIFQFVSNLSREREPNESTSGLVASVAAALLFVQSQMVVHLTLLVSLFHFRAIFWRVTQHVAKCAHVVEQNGTRDPIELIFEAMRRRSRLVCLIAECAALGGQFTRSFVWRRAAYAVAV